MSWVRRRTAADTHEPPAERAVRAVCVVAAFAALAWQGHRFFPLPYGFLGHDYGLFLPHLLIGENWFHQNGLFAAPYYTPAFCGGMPWLGNPQSIVYSLPQALVIALDPIQTFYATLLFSATAGAIGTYGLLRRGLGTTASAATLGAVLFLLNGFLFYRMAVGHVTFHVIFVAPLAAWAVLHPLPLDASTARGRAWAIARRSVLGGCLIAYVAYGGALHLIIPIVLAIAAVVLVAQVHRGPRTIEWTLLAGSCAWALAIAAMKLAPAFILAGKFPRPYIPENLFDSGPGLLAHMAMGLFGPELLPADIALGAGRTTLSKHELEYGMSVVPLLLVGVAIWRVDLRRRLREAMLPAAALFALLLLPAILNAGPDWWGRFLLEVPILQNNTTFIRWWLIYLLPLAIAAALALDVLATTSRMRTIALTATVAGAVGQLLMRDISYYTDPVRNYNPKFVVAAHDALKAGVPLPNIERVGRPEYLHARTSYFARNDAFLNGATSWPCYDGLFGYELELLPDLGLREGPVLEYADDGRLNFVDPESYLNTEPGAPKAARFAGDRIGRARTFASYRPVPQSVPAWQQRATALTVATLTISLLVLVASAVARVARRGLRL